MTILDKNTIDIISIQETKCFLIIAQHMEWDYDPNLYEATILELLENKINIYLAYIENQLYSDYPEAKNKDLVIEVGCKYPLNKEAECFFANVKIALKKELNIELTYEIVK